MVVGACHEELTAQVLADKASAQGISQMFVAINKDMLASGYCYKPTKNLSYTGQIELSKSFEDLSKIYKNLKVNETFYPIGISGFVVFWDKVTTNGVVCYRVLEFATPWNYAFTQVIRSGEENVPVFQVQTPKTLKFFPRLLHVGEKTRTQEVGLNQNDIAYVHHTITKTGNWVNELKHKRVKLVWPKQKKKHSIILS